MKKNKELRNQIIAINGNMIKMKKKGRLDLVESRQLHVQRLIKKIKQIEGVNYKEIVPMEISKIKTIGVVETPPKKKKVMTPKTASMPNPNGARTLEKLGEVRSFVDKIHGEVDELFEMAIRNKEKLCIAKAYRVYEVFREISKRKRELRAMEYNIFYGKYQSHGTYCIRSERAIEFLSTISEKQLYNTKKYNVMRVRKRNDKWYLLDLKHAFEGMNLNMGQAYKLLKEIMRISVVINKTKIEPIKYEYLEEIENNIFKYEKKIPIEIIEEKKKNIFDKIIAYANRFFNKQPI